MMGLSAGKDLDFAVGSEFENAVNLFAEAVNGKIIPWDFNQTRVAFRENGRSVFVDFAKLKGPDILADLHKRDFTINALAVDINCLNEKNPELIDPLAGSSDIKNRTIKVCSSSAFDDDPLRVLRGIRFARKSGFSIENQTFELMRKKAVFIKRVSAERFKREFFAILHLPDALKSVNELMDIGILNMVIPELKNFASVSQGPPHQNNLLEHSLKTVEHISCMLENNKHGFNKHINKISDYFNEEIEAAVTRRALLVFSGIVHDIGKTVTRKEQGSTITFYGHEKQGAKLNRKITERLKLGRSAQRIVEEITQNHMRILQLLQLDKITGRAKHRFLRDVANVPLEVIFLAIADNKATGTESSYLRNSRGLHKLTEELIETVLSPDETCAEPAVTGSDVMDILGIPRGPEVGNILKQIHDRERQGLFKNREDAIQWLKKKKK